MRKRIFSREFKLSVLHELESGRTTAHVCRDHDLNKDLVWRWRKEYRENPGLAFAGKGNASSLETKNVELERTVGQLYMENAFLKKVLKKLENMPVERAKEK